MNNTILYQGPDQTEVTREMINDNLTVVADYLGGINFLCKAALEGCMDPDQAGQLRLITAALHKVDFLLADITPERE
ncbi:hypothetical protein LJC46_08455 [Desulfovibrio sp. OttesenSCG-928-G15]|nr:hypothetical protein [Desulfovibrio sp. OttesenSCG-928-G15]